MKIFVGEYTNKIDDKGRMVFPSDFKSRLLSLGQQTLVAKKDFHEDCIVLYTLEAWNEYAENLKQRLNLFNKEHANIWREFMRNRAEVTPDEKTGRILIPRQLLEMIGVEKEVVFSGMDDRIELWAKEKFEQIEQNGTEISEAISRILG